MVRANPLILAVAGCALSWAPTLAQDLPLRREIPGIGPVQCAIEAPNASPSADERVQAAELGSSAGQAVILGDRGRARDLLARATELDPTSAPLAYQYGRVLDDLGQRPAAMDQYCTVLALDPATDDAADVQNRLNALSAEERRAIPDQAVADFQMGLASADAGRYDTSAEAFGRAVSTAPGWADAHYDRGVVNGLAGAREQAVADLQRYLELRPDALDALAVSQRIGQLQTPLNLPSPGGALALGLILPGMGHFYSGRPLGGLAVLALVGGGVAAALLIEEVNVRCLAPIEPGEDCPPGQIGSETKDNPYRSAGLGAAAAVTVISAIEAFVKARGRRSEGDRSSLALEVGGFRVQPFDVVARGRSLDFRLIRLVF